MHFCFLNFHDTSFRKEFGAILSADAEFLSLNVYVCVCVCVCVSVCVRVFGVCF
jgi:hypothetical protein